MVLDAPTAQHRTFWNSLLPRPAEIPPLALDPVGVPHPTRSSPPPAIPPERPSALGDPTPQHNYVTHSRLCLCGCGTSTLGGPGPRLWVAKERAPGRSLPAGPRPLCLFLLESGRGGLTLRRRQAAWGSHSPAFRGTPGWFRGSWPPASSTPGTRGRCRHPCRAAIGRPGRALRTAGPPHLPSSPPPPPGRGCRGASGYVSAFQPRARSLRPAGHS